MSDLIGFIETILALTIAIVGHEWGHGFVAYKLGDETAKRDGRLSLNPIRHIDLTGLIFMIVFRFGWAKAVPINPYYFKNRKRDTILVSLAGVGVNFLMAIIVSPLLAYAHVNGHFLMGFLSKLLWYNVMLGVFNLVPLPPLDGSKVVASLLPDKLEYYFYKYEKYFYIFLLIVVFSGYVNKIIGPIIVWILDILLNFGGKILYGL